MWLRGLPRAGWLIFRIAGAELVFWQRGGGMRVLIIEDNRDLVANIVDYLEARGHSTDWAADGITGLHLATTTGPDVIVLDLALPGLDGVEICARLRRERYAIPLIMLTARGELDDRVQGLNVGADDYLVKPVALRELEARLQAQLRRARGGVAQPRWQVADLVLDDATRQVTRASQPVELTRLDYDILRVLMRESPAVVARGRLEAEIWGDEPPGNDTLRAHIHRLRRAVERDDRPALLHTVHGIGYRLAAPHETTS